MNTGTEWLLRHVEIDGRRGLEVLLRDGRITEIGTAIACEAPVIDAGGGALLPGLVDHHLHLLAFAARRQSVAVDPESVGGASGFAAALRNAAARLGDGEWIRAVGYHDSVAGPLSRERLDRLVGDRPLRVQQSTGSLWTLNSAALERVVGAEPPPECVERDAAGRLTGRIWRGDDWLRGRMKSAPPPLAPVGRQLSAWGITAVSDASYSNGAGQARLLAEAHRSGALPQKLWLMSAGELPPAAGGEYAIGPVKILLDDHALPTVDDMVERIRRARRWQRRVAVHCVTAAELAVTLAAFGEAGSTVGDRIEHGGVIPENAIAVIRDLQLTVVTQSAFIAERGERYRREVDAVDLDSLYRAGSLLRAGIPLAGSSDAPYTCGDPWAAIDAAMQRRTSGGHRLGEGERLSAEQALALYLSPADAPGRAAPKLQAGQCADLCLLRRPLTETLRSPGREAVAATFIDGRPVYRAAGNPP